ncbi:MAG: PorV/PorQ family protein [Saprospiraceae bacterium]|nr:PorV/PorQ family protein [Saprospiraceae bacterium]
MIIKAKHNLLFLFFIVSATVSAQVFDPTKGCVVDNNGDCISNTLLTAVPFLRITPDARSGAMGDAGLALRPNSNSMHFNPSNLVFAEDKSAFSFTYTPWLRNLNLNDIFLLYVSGYYKLDKNQAIGGGIRFFSLGDIDFTDTQGGSLGTGRPREGEFTIAYARKLGDKFSASLSGKYIFSNLASGLQVNGVDINTASAFAADFGLNYRTKTTLGGYKGEWSYGLAFTNIGYNSLTFAVDLNKLLVPTPISKKIVNNDGTFTDNPEWDTDGNGIADYREKSLFAGVLGSFNDAQGGIAEEVKEVSLSIGAEYWYDKQFAFRGGYYWESAEKGNRRFFTVGAGIKYNVFGIDLSYLIPTSILPNPLDNTLRFSLLFDFSVFQSDIQE